MPSMLSKWVFVAEDSKETPGKQNEKKITMFALKKNT